MEKESKLFSKNPNRYQTAMNEASLKLCKETPSLLKNRGKLLELARQAVHNSGFQYAKKHSRSKVLVENKDDDEKPAKRVKVSTEMRQERINELTDDIKEIDMQLSLYTRQREKNINSHLYQGAINVTEEMTKLKTKKREKNAELTLLLKKDAKAKNRKPSVGHRACNPPSKVASTLRSTSKEKTSNMTQKTLDVLIMHERKNQGEDELEELMEVPKKTSTTSYQFESNIGAPDKTKHQQYTIESNTSTHAEEQEKDVEQSSFL